MKLNVEIQGQGFPILCLHGHPGSAQAMSVFTDHLSQRFLTLAPDLRGYGRSRVRQNFTMNDHLDDLEALLDAHNISECLLLGWSLGGILALELALRNPQRYRGLVLIATSACPRSNHPPIQWYDLLYTGIAGIVNWIIPSWTWNIKTFGSRSLFRYLLGQQTPEAYRYLATAAIPAYLQTSAAAQRALNQALQQGYNRLDVLHQITQPCLVLAGDRDRHITAESSRIMAEKLPHSQWYCYAHRAHLFPWEIPEQMLQDIDAWLDQHSVILSSE
ncbi:MAG: alpha/beta hydrolase [Jaaginema sp. PMC 1079.18]|nr:alpha/beta hydrolase [Jaaginema sp. PMC 1080.18]MEC4849996.1 alpha/beta hydrolase [Jaaginema sp. PMC 1079.18]MEC4866488.1 alpha/beta hydrolase [Jaaginema sp. PMC 1078.18]